MSISTVGGEHDFGLQIITYRTNISKQEKIRNDELVIIDKLSNNKLCKFPY